MKLRIKRSVQRGGWGGSVKRMGQMCWAKNRVLICLQLQLRYSAAASCGSTGGLTGCRQVPAATMGS